MAFAGLGLAGAGAEAAGGVASGGLSFIPAAIGALGAIFGGGGHSGPDPNLSEIYKKFGKAFDMSMNFYNEYGTPQKLAERGQNALYGPGGYADQIMKESQAELGSYDASAAAAGSPIYETSTAKEQARASIANANASKIAGMQYNQTMQIPAESAALLPNPNQAAAGFAGAQALDAGQNAYQSGVLNSILDLSSLIPGQQQSPFQNLYNTGGNIAPR